MGQKVVQVGLQAAPQAFDGKCNARKCNLGASQLTSKTSMIEQHHMTTGPSQTGRVLSAADGNRQRIILFQELDAV